MAGPVPPQTVTVGWSVVRVALRSQCYGDVQLSGQLFLAGVRGNAQVVRAGAAGGEGLRRGINNVDVPALDLRR